MGENVTSWEALNSWSLLQISRQRRSCFQPIRTERQDRWPSRYAQSCRQPFFSNGSVNRFEEYARTWQPAGHFVAATFADLLYSGSKSRGRTERILGTAPAAVHFPRNFSRVAGRRARHPSLRALASAGSRPSQTRREVWPDMAESITSILIRN